MLISEDSHISLVLAIAPSGNLYLDTSSEGQEVLSQDVRKLLESLFKDDYQKGLLYLGLGTFSETLPSSFSFWRKFSQRFILQICRLPEVSQSLDNVHISLPLQEELQEFICQAPFMKGSEYLTEDLLATLWHGLHKAFIQELATFNGNVKELLNAHNSSWNLVGCVYFHLAENKSNTQTPFAFLATYTTRLSENSAPKHVPLGRALEEYADEKNKPALLALLVPIQKASAQSAFVKELVDSGEIFRPLTWSAKQAYTFLTEIALYEECGIIIRIPNWWNTKKPVQPQVTVEIGENKASLAGFQSMLDFNIRFALSNGQELSEEEWQEILRTKEPFIKVKGQWVAVNHDQLETVLAHWKNIQQQVKRDGLTFAEGIRLVSGSASMHSLDPSLSQETLRWSSVKAGAWLKDVLYTMRNPEHAASKNIESIVATYLHATLRPYQMSGVLWLWLLYNLKLGGCLADDMGLGKTIQVLSLLLLIKYQYGTKPHLLVVPASLLGNWQAEIKRFAPSLHVAFVHPSMEGNLKNSTAKELETYDLVITTYTFLHRLPSMAEVTWDMVILDEAQMIKNPNTQQTRGVKGLRNSVRFVLTGTPIENRLSDLWSLFDFFAPGLLGSLRDFSGYAKKASSTDDKKQFNFYSTVRTLTGPYILRRLKTDKRIIADLPDKTEIPAFCMLTKRQVALYAQAVEELKQQLEVSDGIKRQGLIFNYLMRFKQICNHPCQWLGYGSYEPTESGKFLRMTEICQEIAAKGEKVLVFTQFQEIIPALLEHLSALFNREGLVLHGDVPIKKRTALVDAFSKEQGPPFFILSLKAGGTGLNLTNASHVIHFDRWWNPAVENQATDRAYRIGQKKNVMVYKFICQGTIEEKIDELIKVKKSLSDEVVEPGKEIILTELTDEQLLNIVSLDIHRACEEA